MTGRKAGVLRGSDDTASRGIFRGAPDNVVATRGCGESFFSTDAFDRFLLAGVGRECDLPIDSSGRACFAAGSLRTLFNCKFCRGCTGPERRFCFALRFACPRLGMMGAISAAI